MAREKQTLQEQLLKDITAFLVKAKIPYMVTGSLSVILYGRPRASHDIDFLIEAKQEDIIKLVWYKESKSEKHFIDAAFVYQIQKDNLDEKYLREWSKQQGTTKLLKEIGIIDLEEYY